MFRRFINLGLSEGVPDHSTIWRFRNNLTKQGLLDALLLEVNRQLSAKGLYIKTGEVSIVENKAEMARCSAGKLFFQVITQLDISATAIRSMIARGNSPRFLLPDAVIGYISEYRLYK